MNKLFPVRTIAGAQFQQHRECSSLWSNTDRMGDETEEVGWTCKEWLTKSFPFQTIPPFWLQTNTIGIRNSLFTWMVTQINTYRRGNKRRGGRIKLRKEWLTLFAAFADPSRRADTLARHRVTLVGVDTVTLVVTVDAPRTSLAICIANITIICTTRQSEMTDPRSLWHTCDGVAHVFIISHVWRRGILWWHILSYLAMVKNTSLNSSVHIWMPIPIISEENRAMAKLFLVLTLSVPSPSLPRQRFMTLECQVPVFRNQRCSGLTAQ